MIIKLEVSEVSLRKILLAYFKEQLGEAGESLVDKDIEIQVKSKSNYKAEWEAAAFRAVVNKVA